MSSSLAPILIHSEDVPLAARAALRNALYAPAERRGAELARAARLLYRETDLDCAEVHELVGLSAAGTCAGRRSRRRRGDARDDPRGVPTMMRQGEVDDD